MSAQKTPTEPIVSETPADGGTSTKSIQRDIVTRWGGDAAILAERFVAVPLAFLYRHAALKPHSLTPTEAMFIIYLMSHKWDARAPFPSYKRLAQYLGKTESYARKLARNLETKGMLRRLPRVGDTNEFDLSPLFTKVIQHGQASQSGSSPTASKTKTTRKRPPAPRSKSKSHKRRAA